MESQGRVGRIKSLASRAIAYYRQYGAMDTLKKVYKKFNARRLRKNAIYNRKVKFSILVPLYNTRECFLTEMLDSVFAQTYTNWELCLQDGSDEEHSYVGDICIRYAHGDKRIKYKKLKKNMGISGNTNECLKLATGNFISLLDHDDLLTCDALYETKKAILEKNALIVYSDEDKVNEDTTSFYEHHYKPDYAPDYLRSTNYICHFLTINKCIINKIGLFNHGFDGSQDFDLVLRATEQTDRIYHVPKILYHWRAHSGSTAANFDTKSYAVEAGRKAVASHLERIKLKGEVVTLQPGVYRIVYNPAGEPLVSIILVNRDNDNLEKCVHSIQNKTTYNNYEIIKIDISGDGANYSKILNNAVKQASGEVLLFLECNIEVITENWIEELLMLLQRKDVGVVGGKVLSSDMFVRNAGVVIGLTDTVNISFYGKSAGEQGYACRLISTQNYNAVTSDCLMINKALFLDLGGFSEEMGLSLFDIDLCMRVRKKELLVVWTPFCELRYNEREIERIVDGRMLLDAQEREVFINRWQHCWAAGDPYYNINFSRDNANYEM